MILKQRSGSVSRGIDGWHDLVWSLDGCLLERMENEESIEVDVLDGPLVQGLWVQPKGRAGWRWDLRPRGVQSIPWPDGVVQMRLTKLTEPLCGRVRISVIHDQSPVPGPTLLVLGDSQACGYGVLAQRPEEGFRSSTEDARLAAPALAASALGLEPRLVAWSGKGLMWNWSRDTSPTIPDLWRDVHRSESLADLPTPRGVLVMLGANDLGRPTFPEREAWTRSWQDFLHELGAAYEGAPLMVVAGALVRDAHPVDFEGRPLGARTFWNEVVTEAIARLPPMIRERITRGELSEDDGSLPRGADNHSGPAQHRLNARELEVILRKALPSCPEPD